MASREGGVEGLWRSELPQAWGALALGLLLTFGAWAALRLQERRATRAAFESSAVDLEGRLRQNLETQADTLRACQGLFDSDDAVKPEEWDRFVSRIWSEDRNPGLVALAYAPVQATVPVARGDAHEIWRAQARGFSRDYSAPLCYSAPLKLDEWDPSLRDLLADPTTRATALEALSRGRAAAGPFRSTGLRGHESRQGFWLVTSVRAERAPAMGVGRSEPAGPGLVAGVCDIEAILAHTQPDDGSLLLELSDTTGSRVSVPVPGSSVGVGSLRQDRPISFGGRYWTLSVLSTRRFHGRQSWLPWGVLTVGCFASLGLFVATLFLLRGRRKAESLVGELGLSEARYRDLIQGIGDLVYRVDLEGRFTFLNAASERLLGYRPEELEGRPVRVFLDDLSRRQARTALPLIRAGQVVLDIPIGFVCKDGETRWLAATATALHDPEGRVIGTQGTMRDVTAARLAQQALEESEQKFRVFAETVSCIILLFDDRIRYVNPFATQMLGWAPEEILGKPFWDIVHPDDKVLVRERGEARLRGEAVPARYEFRVLTKSGETRWVDFTANRASFGGHAYGLGTVFDVTDRVGAVDARIKMERRLLEAQKLESLGLLAGGVAHDFNNLLAAILGNAELATELAPMESPLRAPLHQIENACMRASELTRQMLAYAGQGKFVIEPLELGQAVRGIADLMRASIPRVVEVQLELTAENLWLEGDSAQVQQVILNLVTNASEAIGPEGGRILIRSGKRGLELREAAGLRASEEVRPGPMVYLEVTDTGQGMDAATLERIFDPFFTTKFQGRGLGLAAMQGIVKGHGGAIDVKSAPGKGTTFRIYFPELTRR